MSKALSALLFTIEFIFSLLFSLWTLSVVLVVSIAGAAGKQYAENKGERNEVDN